MTLPSIERHKVDKIFEDFCEKREALKAREHERLEFKVKANSVTLIDSKPINLDFGTWTHKKIAHFEFSVGIEKWKLYWYDNFLKRHVYPVRSGTETLEELIKEVERDCTGIFWG